MTDEVDELIKLSLNKPVRLSADPKTQRPSTLTEEYDTHFWIILLISI